MKTEPATRAVIAAPSRGDETELYTRSRDVGLLGSCDRRRCQHSTNGGESAASRGALTAASSSGIGRRWTTPRGVVHAHHGDLPRVGRRARRDPRRSPPRGDGVLLPRRDVAVRGVPARRRGGSGAGRPCTWRIARSVGRSEPSGAAGAPKPLAEHGSLKGPNSDHAPTDSARVSGPWEVKT
jgi:hypothetical protein